MIIEFLIYRQKLLTKIVTLTFIIIGIYCIMK